MIKLSQYKNLVQKCTKLPIYLLLFLTLMFSAHAIVPTDSDLSFWSFENNVLDLTPQGNDLTIGSIAPTFTTEHFISGSYSTNFSGNDNWWIAPIDENDFPDEKVTASVWLRFPTATPISHEFVFGSDSGSYRSSPWIRLLSTGLLSGGVRGQDGSINSLDILNGAVTPNQWYHIVMTYDGTNALVFYVDGVFAKQINGSTGNFGNFPPITIGYRADVSGQDYNGLMDDLAFFNYFATQDNVTDLYNGGASIQPPYGFVPVPQIIVNAPVHTTNFTFDVEQIPFNIDSDVNSSCSYTWNTTTTDLNTSDNLNHLGTFDMGSATTSQKAFEVQFDCADLTNTSLIGTSNVTFYQRQVPVNLTLFVPIDEQTFIRPINAIEFHIETNYQAECNYLVTNITNQTYFSSTNNSLHKTNYSTLFPNIDTYPLTFTCVATILGDNVSRSLTFFLQDDNVVVGLSGMITETSGQLPQVGSDLGGFLKNLAPGVVAFIFVLSIVGSIIALFGAVIFLIKKYMGKKK